MDSRIFFWSVMARLALILGSSALFIWLVQTLEVEMIFTMTCGAFLITVQVILLSRYVLRLSRVMEQFMQSVSGEGSPEIKFKTGKRLYRKLTEQSNTIKASMNARRLEKEKDDQILIHVINEADPGILCFNSREEVLFANEAARGLLSNNEKLWKTLKEVQPGTPRVLRLSTSDHGGDAIRGEQLISIRLKEVKIFEDVYSIFSLQNIQEELHKNESDSWQKIIRVLTHEIMNAVTPMLSLSKSLQSRLNNETLSNVEKIAEGLRMIETTGKGLMEFTEEYRRLSLLPAPKKEKLLLSDALNRLLLLFDKEAEDQHVRLTLDMDLTKAEIFADPRQFEMIMLNLLKNAFDSFPEGQDKREVSIHVQEKEKRILVEVKDNGPGIPGELIDQVFVPFFSTKEQGSGIGLSLSRQIMNNHGGTIQLESHPGESTLVRLVFTE